MNACQASGNECGSVINVNRNLIVYHDGRLETTVFSDDKKREASQLSFLFSILVQEAPGCLFSLISSSVQR